MAGEKPFWKEQEGFGKGAEGNMGPCGWEGVDTLEMDAVESTGVH